MFHNKFSRFLAVFITVVSLCAFGCKTQPEEDFISDLYGKWTSSFGEVFEISKDYFKNYGEDWNGYEGDSIIIITNEGIIIRLAVDKISEMSRVTQGVKLINLRENQKVSSISIVDTEEEVNETNEMVDDNIEK